MLFLYTDAADPSGFVYRFVATGTVEEKSASLSGSVHFRTANRHEVELTPTEYRVCTVFQRQSHKQNLSSVVVDSKEDMERYFSGNDLRQLFSLNPSPCEVSRVKALSVETLLELITNAILLAPTRRRMTCSSASAAMTVAKSSRLRRCSMAIPRREFLFGPTICPASAFVVDFWWERLPRASSRWNHLRNEDLAKNHDLLLRAEHGIEGVTACFQCKSPWSSSRRYGRLADCSGAIFQTSRRKTKKQTAVLPPGLPCPLACLAPTVPYVSVSIPLVVASASCIPTFLQGQRSDRKFLVPSLFDSCARQFPDAGLDGERV